MVMKGDNNHNTDPSVERFFGKPGTPPAYQTSTMAPSIPLHLASRTLKYDLFCFFATFVTFWTLSKAARNSPGLSVWLPCSDLWVLRLEQVCGFSGQTAAHNFFDGTKFTHQPQKKAPPCRLWCILHNWTDHTLTVCSWAAVDLMQ